MAPLPPTRRNRTSGPLSPNGFEVRPQNHLSSSWHPGNIIIPQVSVMALTSARVTPGHPCNAPGIWINQRQHQPFRKIANGVFRTTKKRMRSLLTRRHGCSEASADIYRTAHGGSIIPLESSSSSTRKRAGLCCRLAVPSPGASLVAQASGNRLQPLSAPIACDRSP